MCARACTTGLECKKKTLTLQGSLECAQDCLLDAFIGCERTFRSDPCSLGPKKPWHGVLLKSLHSEPCHPLACLSLSLWPSDGSSHSSGATEKNQKSRSGTAASALPARLCAEGEDIVTINWLGNQSLEAQGKGHFLPLALALHALRPFCLSSASEKHPWLERKIDPVVRRTTKPSSPLACQQNGLLI